MDDAGKETKDDVEEIVREWMPWVEAHNSQPPRKECNVLGDHVWDLLYVQLASYLEGGTDVDDAPAPTN